LIGGVYKCSSMSSTGIDEGQPDLSRKQRRDAARAQRKAAEQAAVATAARRTRLTQLGIVLAVVVVGVVAVLIATGGGEKKGIPSSPVGQQTVAKEVSSLLAGIPQNGNVLGSPTAPVTLQYFGDLECPFCRQFTLSALPSIIQKSVRGGQLKIEYRSMETATRDPEVFKAQQVAALAAGRQGKMWNFVETFYHEQGEEATGYATESYFQGIAKQVPGLNLSRWMNARSEAALANQVASDQQAANSAGIKGTPAFLIGRSGGAMKQFEPSSLTEAGSFTEAIEKLVKS
jgi:protein-disulfide isomerase